MNVSIAVGQERSGFLLRLFCEGGGIILPLPSSGVTLENVRFAFVTGFIALQATTNRFD
jgi:hypothetical protein